MYAHVGGSPQAMQTLREQGQGQLVYNADEFRWGGVFFHRTRDRFAPHNVYTSGKELWQLARRIGAKNGSIKPACDSPATSTSCSGPRRHDHDRHALNTITYRYDPRPTRTGARCRVRNASRPRHRQGRGPEERHRHVHGVRPPGRREPEERLEAQSSGGTAWIATNGRRSGHVRKTSMTAPTRFFDAKGSP